MADKENDTDDELMNTDDSSSEERSQNKESDDEESVSEDEINVEVEHIKAQLERNPFDYDLHVQMIATAGKAKKHGEYELVRSAREAMSAKFPLTPEMWLEWIEDERKLSTMVDPKKVEERERIMMLFDRALDDYVSIEVWMKYCDYIISFIDEPGALEWISKKFDRALQEVGLHVSKGTLIWETYRELLKALSNISDKLEDKLVKYDKIFDLYKRQLSVPLFGMQQIYSEFKDWCAQIKETIPNFNGDPDSVKFAYNKAYSMLQKVQVYEDELHSDDKPKLDAYLKYIEFEEANGSPPRVQFIYERALIDHCLVPELWIGLTRYLGKNVKIPEIIKKTYERAIRNYPWSIDIWINYINACELLKEDLNTIMKIFERALVAGFQTGAELRSLWLTYLNCLRRQTNWKDADAVEKLKKTFQAGIDHLSSIEYGDPDAELPFYLAKIHAKCLDDLESARNLLAEVFKQRDFSCRAKMWIEYAYFERSFGDEKHYKKVLLRALNFVNDWPETIGAELLKYEREEGSSLEQYDEIVEKYESVMKKIRDRRETQAEKDKEKKSNLKGKQSQKFEDKGFNPSKNQYLKRKVGSETTFEPDNASMVKADLTSAEDSGLSNVNKKLKLSASATTDEAILAEMKRQQEIAQRPDDIKKMRTVFLSNLDFKVNEDAIRNVFGEFGTIVDLRLVRNYKGQSKGFCYVEYAGMEGVREALKHDRVSIESRPVFVSQMGKKTEFKFKNAKEMNKLFVKNLAPSVNDDLLRSTFSKYGKIRDVRVVTYRNGHSKGCAYIEYEDELDAQKALKADGMLLADKTIKVAISDPSTKGKNQEKVLGAGVSAPSLKQQAGPSGLGAKKKIDLSSMVPASVRRAMSRNGSQL